MKYIRQRYILFEIIPEQEGSIDSRDLLNIIWNVLKNIFGLKVTYQVGLWLIRWDAIKKIGILRMDNLTKHQVIASLALITHIRNRSIVIHTRKTTGTIKKALKLSEKYFNCQPPPLKEFKHNNSKDEAKK